MIYQLQDLDKYSAALLPERCRGCGWWQGYDSGWPGETEAFAWADAAADAFGPWGKLALGDDQVLGMVQYGPAALFSRTRQLPSGPVSEDAVLLTCSAVATNALETVRKSLVTAVLAELHHKGIGTVEAFCAEDKKNTSACQFFPQEFLQDCGFCLVRNHKGLKLMRLELGGMEPSISYKVPRRSILQRLKAKSASPAPVAMTEALNSCSCAHCAQDG
ncbi:MAG: hypothetical protein ACYCXF_00530 [Thermoleophilia bacterium]